MQIQANNHTHANVCLLRHFKKNLSQIHRSRAYFTLMKTCMVCQLNLLGLIVKRVTSGCALICWKKSEEQCLEISLNSKKTKTNSIYGDISPRCRAAYGRGWPPYVLCICFHLIGWCEEMRINTESPERRSASRRIARLKEERSGKFNPNKWHLEVEERWV